MTPTATTGRTGAALPEGYRIRRSDRARRISVRVLASDDIEVVLPRRATERDAQRAVRALRPQVDRRIAARREAEERVAARGAAVPYLGELLRVTVEPGRRRVHCRGDELLVGHDASAALERWYRARAREEVGRRLDEATATAGTPWNGLTIRDQRTRWASCSSKGAMNFSWRLLLAPAEVLDYVVWHEVCHLRVADHSPRFWRLVEQRFPDHPRHRAWLREHGPTLVLPPGLATD